MVITRARLEKTAAVQKGVGTLIMIGGAERKERRGSILKEVCRRAIAESGKLVLITAATQVPLAYLDAYLPVFADLGVKNVDVIDIRSREDAYGNVGVRKLFDASVVFFTGGQQLRLGSQMGGTPVC